MEFMVIAVCHQGQSLSSTNLLLKTTTIKPYPNK